MGIRSRFGVEGKPPLTVLADLGAALKRAVELRLPASRETLPIDMLASNCLPYQVSKTYNKMKIEAACIQAQTIMEVQRSLCRL